MTDRQNQLGSDHTTPRRGTETAAQWRALNEKRVPILPLSDGFGRLLDWGVVCLRETITTGPVSVAAPGVRAESRST
jgi:hypothetical protein